jgi:glycosyltransferase involved in cell wall biosynthesis
MKNRFTQPRWVKEHSFDYSDWKTISPEKIASIKNGIARFNSTNPIVSIVIPVWNEEKNILRTLSSFSAMNLPWATELIIVNNNSTDETQAILDYFNVKSIIEKKQGIAHARLAGLKGAKGYYHLCGDGDSLYPPHWVSNMVKGLQNSSVTCVYANYSFIPVSTTSRITLGCYELMAEALFEVRRMKREFLNVRGANFGFRKHQGLQVKGFEMPITRVFDNDEATKTFVVFGEDGRMGRKLGEIGKLKLIRTSGARIWTSSRRLVKDGSLSKAFLKRIVKESGRLFEYFAGPSKVKNTTDSLTTQSF